MEENSTNSQNYNPKFEPSFNEQQNNSQSNYRKYLPLAMALGFVILVLMVVAIFKQTNNLSSLNSQAGCSGYACEPMVSLGGRIVENQADAGKLIYGALIAQRNQSVQLSWIARNVDFCEAKEGWSNYKGLYLAPTPISMPAESNKVYKVACYSKNQVVAENEFNLVVVNSNP